MEVVSWSSGSCWLESVRVCAFDKILFRVDYFICFSLPKFILCPMDSFEK